MIGTLVGEIRRFLPRVVVVDDGSTDATGLRAREAGATVIEHRRNQGKGAALRTGLQHACASGFKQALTLDGDGQHRPSDIGLFLECADRTGAALVVGNRLHNAQAMPWARRWVNRWMTHRISQMTGHVLADSQCGFRLLDLGAWAALALETDHFEVESEMLLVFLAAGRRVEFVPVEVVGRGPRSHIRPLVDGWRWWRWWRRARPAQAARTGVCQPS